MFAYLAAIWNCRYFWLSLVQMDLRSRYRGSVLGMCWSLLHPIAMTTILCVVFGVAFHMPWRTYAPFVFIGMTFWGYFSAATVQACGCFFQGESYIRQFPAPMAIYPLRTVLGAAFHFGIGLILALAIALYTGPDVDISPGATQLSQLMALPSLLLSLPLLLLFGWSVAILSGLLCVRFRDMRHLMEIGLQGLFYLTPIMINPRSEAMRVRGRLTLVLECNPLTSFLHLLRDPILYGQVPSLTTYAVAGGIVLVMAGVAVAALRIEERRLIFHL